MTRKPFSLETTIYNSLEKASNKIGNKYINTFGDFEKTKNIALPALIGSLGIGLTYYITQKLKENERLRKRKFLGLF